MGIAAGCPAGGGAIKGVEVGSLVFSAVMVGEGKGDEAGVPVSTGPGGTTTMTVRRGPGVVASPAATGSGAGVQASSIPNVRSTIRAKMVLTSIHC